MNKSPEGRFNDDGSKESTTIQRVVEGEVHLFRLLVEEHEGYILRLLFRQLGDQSVAEELTQETFIRAFKRLKSFRGEAAFRTWITRIAFNQAHTYFASKRYRNSRKNESLEEFNESDNEWNSPNPERELQSRRAVKVLQEKIACLSEKQREVFVLCALEGETYEDVALTLGIPVGTVRSRLNHARLALKAELADILER